jgi:ribonuclease HI
VTNSVNDLIKILRMFAQGLNIREIAQKFPAFDTDKIADLLEDSIAGLERQQAAAIIDPVFTDYIDGACRGNPGPGSVGVVLCNKQGEVIEQIKEVLGPCTNNVAEYSALLRALEKAQQLKFDSLLIKSDSQLLVNQMQGTYKVKDEKIKILYDQAQALIQGFRKIEFLHIPRVENKLADELANAALDGK